MMSVKSRVLEIMEKNRSKAISGQELADYLSVSRAAIWKAIRSLKEEGYQIEATTNKGYLLMDNNDILSGEGIKTYLQPEYQIIRLLCTNRLIQPTWKGKNSCCWYKARNRYIGRRADRRKRQAWKKLLFSCPNWNLYEYYFKTAKIS